jgi:hypothetical protein
VPFVLARMANDGVILVSAVSSGLSVMRIENTDRFLLELHFCYTFLFCDDILLTIDVHVTFDVYDLDGWNFLQAFPVGF